MFGYMSWAACLPEDGAVIVVLSNRVVHELSVELFFRPLRPFVEFSIRDDRSGVGHDHGRRIAPGCYVVSGFHGVSVARGGRRGKL